MEFVIWLLILFLIWITLLKNFYVFHLNDEKVVMILIEGNKFSIGKVLQKKLMLFMLGLIYVVLW